MNSPDEADASAQSISNAYGGKEVVVKHNPTDFPSYLDSRTRIEEEDRLSRELADLIRELIKDKDHLVLFAHSHGAVITDLALQQLEPQKRGRLRIYTFGGASVIPKRLAGVVKNFVFKDDIVARVGNINSQRSRVLYSMNLIDGELSEMSCEQAIHRRAYHSLCNSMRRGSREFQTIVLEKNLDKARAHPKYIKEVARYKNYFEKYDVTFLNGEEFQPPEYKSLRRHSSTFFEFYKTIGINIFRGVAALGANALKNHEFASYTPQIEEIAGANPE